MHNRMKRLAVLLLSAAMMPCPVAMRAQTARLKGSLNRLLSIAEAHNASLRTVRAAITEAEAGVEAAQKAKLPDVNAQLSVSYLGNARLWNRHFGESTCAPMPHYGNNFLLQAQQVVYAGGAVSAGIQLARQNAAMQNINAADERRRVQFLLTGLFLQLHNLQNQAEVYAANKALAEKQIEMMRQRYAKGVSLHSDVTRYELYLQQMELGMTSVTDQADIVRRQLLTALGTDSAAIGTLPEDAFADDAIAVGSEADWQLTAAGQHPGVQRLALGVQMSRTEEKLERAALLPKVAIIAEDHLDGPITIEVPPIDKNLNYWFVGVGVTYNFSALYKNRSKVRRARLHTAWQNESLSATRENVADAVHAAFVSLGTARTQLDEAQREERRYAQLLKGDAVTRQQYDAMHTALLAAKARYAQAVRRHATLTDTGKEQGHRLAQNNAAVEAARAAVRLARLRLSYTVITATADGVVGRKNIHEGQLVQPGQTMVNIVDNTELWVVANFRETQLPGIAVGADVKIDADAVPGVTFKGTVERISDATGAAMSLVPQDNATGNFVKVEQRIPVRIRLSADRNTERLRAGMNVECEVKPAGK